MPHIEQLVKYRCKTNLCCLIAVVLHGLLLPRQLFGLDVDVQLRGIWSRPQQRIAKAMAVRGSYVYLADYWPSYQALWHPPSSGPAIQVIDFRDPASPKVLTSYFGEAADLCVSGNYLYAAGGALKVFDITNVEELKLITSLETGTIADQLAIDGDYAYVSRVGGDVRVFDIKDRANPKFVAAWPTSGQVTEIAVSGRIAAVATRAPRIVLYDISVPTRPVELRALPHGAFALAIAGERLVSPGVVYDIRDPARAAGIGGFIWDGYPRMDVAVVGPHAFLASSLGGLQVFDVSGTSSPQRVGGYVLGGDAICVEISGTKIYVATSGPSSVSLLEINGPANPQRVAQYYPRPDPEIVLGDTNVFQVTVSGAHAFLAKQRGFEILDVSSLPLRRVGSYRSPNLIGRVAIAEGHAYVTEGQHGMRIVDVRDVTRPVVVGSYKFSNDFLAGALDVALSGGLAYIAYSQGGLRVVDIRNPSQPREIGSEPTIHCTRVLVQSEYAYLQSLGQLSIVRIADPANPKLIGKTIFGGGYDLAVSGKYLYTVSRSYRGDQQRNTGVLSVIDVSDPAAPKRVAERMTPGLGDGIALAGHYAYMADWHAGVHVFDVSNPEDPKHVGTNSSTAAYRVHLNGDRLFVAGGFYGLSVMDLFRPLQLGGAAFSSEGFRFSIHGIAGSRLRIQTSADLLNWQNWTNVSLTGDRFEILDSNGLQGSRFYRAFVED